MEGRARAFVAGQGVRRRRAIHAQGSGRVGRSSHVGGGHAQKTYSRGRVRLGRPSQHRARHARKFASVERVRRRPGPNVRVHRGQGERVRAGGATVHGRDDHQRVELQNPVETHLARRVSRHFATVRPKRPGKVARDERVERDAEETGGQVVQAQFSLRTLADGSDRFAKLGVSQLELQVRVGHHRHFQQVRVPVSVEKEGGAARVGVAQQAVSVRRHSDDSALRSRRRVYQPTRAARVPNVSCEADLGRKLHAANPRVRGVQEQIHQAVDELLSAGSGHQAISGRVGANRVHHQQHATLGHQSDADDVASGETGADERGRRRSGLHVRHGQRGHRLAHRPRPRQLHDRERRVVPRTRIEHARVVVAERDQAGRKVSTVADERDARAGRQGVCVHLSKTTERGHSTHHPQDKRRCSCSESAHRDQPTRDDGGGPTGDGVQKGAVEYGQALQNGVRRRVRPNHHGDTQRHANEGHRAQLDVGVRAVAGGAGAHPELRKERGIVARVRVR